MLLPFLFTAVLVNAEDKKIQPEYGPEKETLIDKALGASDKLEKRVDKTAEKIDIALAGKKYTKKKNDSKLKIEHVTTYGEGGTLRSSTDFAVNLRLPNFEKRWQVRFSSYDEQEERRDMKQRRLRTQPRRREIGAGLLFLRRLGNVKASFQPRLELKDPLEMSYTLRFESSAERKSLRINPRVELFADSEKGTGEFFALDFTADLTRRWGISFQNEEEYRERDNFFRSQHGLNFDYQIDDSKGAGTGVIFSSHNQPSYHLDAITYAVSFAQELVKDRLKYVLSPHLTFPKSRSFKGSSAFSLGIEITF